MPGAQGPRSRHRGPRAARARRCASPGWEIHRQVARRREAPVTENAGRTSGPGAHSVASEVPVARAPWPPGLRRRRAGHPLPVAHSGRHPRRRRAHLHGPGGRPPGPAPSQTRPMGSQLQGLRPWIARELRAIASDAVLAFLAVNVLVSGLLDWSRGTPVGLPFPRPFSRWHLDSSLILVIYLAVHIWRRRKRLRRSTIR